MFKIDLMEHGIGMIFGKDREPLEEIERGLSDMRDVLPAFKEGTPELAAAYIWGAWALGEEEGSGFPPPMAAFYLGLVPRPPGSSEAWLDRLIGPDGLSSADLMEIIRETPQPEVVDEGRESAIITTMEFRLADMSSAAQQLQESLPDGKGFRFIAGEPRQEGALLHFEWARPLPPGPRSIMPVRGDLQIQGWVEVEGDKLRAVTMGLSMAARLVFHLKALFGDAIQLEDVRWKTPEEVMGRKQPLRR
jgi:hypothetical protein